MNNTSIIVILLAIVIALGGGAYLYSQNAAVPVPVENGSGAAGTVPEGTEGDWTDTPEIKVEADASASVSANTVRYTQTGFEPATLTVQKGATVTFINQSGQDMWVASDVHPSHASYDGTSRSEHCAAGAAPSFDQCAPGTSYSFTFTKSGSFSYHNHMNTKFGGTILVTE